MTSRSRVFVTTLCVWCVIVAVLEGVRIWGVLNGPPALDDYANSLSFQLLASGFLLVTMWIPVLIGILLLELIAFGVARRLQAQNHSAL